MFINNKYLKIYTKLTTRGLKNRLLNGPIERHHIIPKSLGGGEINNITTLTLKEHFICHLILPKILTSTYNIKKMQYALWCMINGFGPHSRHSPNSRTYNKIKSEMIKQRKIDMTGSNNHFYGKKHTDKSKKLMSINNGMHRPEIREKTKGHRKGFLPHNHYTGWDDLTKKKISESLKGYKHSNKTKSKMKKSKQNLIWIYNNKDKPKQIKKDNMIDFQDWKRGRGPKLFW